MANINGVIQIEFDTDKPLIEKDHDKFRNFQLKLEKFISDELNMAIYDIANECGFEADSYHPATLDYLQFDADESEDEE